MFIENKYKKWYFNIINHRLINKPDCATIEVHHIIPSSLGGSEEKSNLVSLTTREHFICHLLLTKFTNGVEKSKMCYALHRMVFSSCQNTPRSYTSRVYETARKLHSSNVSEWHKTRRPPEWLENLSRSVKKSWELEQRKKTHLEKVKELWEREPERMKLIAIANLPSDVKGKNNGNVLEIEYKGSVYYGWRELVEGTGVTKHLYKKFYLRGIDPESRIGKNGPPKR